MRAHRIVALACLAVASFLPAAAGEPAAPPPEDVVTLKNGDVLKGKVVSLAKGKLAFETAYAGVLQLDWAQVATLKTGQKLQVKMTTGEVVEGVLAPVEAGKIKVVSTGAIQPVEIEMAKVQYFNEPPVEWHGFVNIAARATDGNTHSKGALLAAEAVRASESDILTIRANFRYTEDRGTISERNAYGLGKYQYLFSPTTYGFASVELFGDRFKDLRLRTVASGGAGYIFLKSAPIDLSADFGIAYIDNDFYEAEDEGHLGGRASASLRVLLPLGFELTDVFVIYPNFKDSQDWQFHNEAALSTALGRGWTLRMGVITDYDRRPSPGFCRADDAYFFGLGYKF